MIEVTERVVVIEAYAPAPPDRIAVRLHPTGVGARGWGYEPETREAVEWLWARVQSGMTVCDVGTGTGILAIIAARLGGVVTAWEIDDRIREIAAANFALNDVRVDLGGAFSGSGDWDLVVANLGDVDYEDLGVLAAGREVWGSG